MGRKRTSDDEKYLKRRRYYLKSKGYTDKEIDDLPEFKGYYLKSKGYTDKEIDDLLYETSKEPEFKGFFNDIDLVNNFNKTLLNLNEGSMDTDNSQETLESNEEIDETNINTNTNLDTNTNTNTNSDTNTNANTNEFVSDNVKFEFDDTLKNEDTNFTQQEQATQDQEDNKEGGSISGKMFMLTFNVLLTTVSKYVKKDLTFNNDEINEFSKLYDEAYPEGLPISPKYVFWGGIIVTISTKALKK